MATKTSKMEKNVESILETVVFIKGTVEKMDVKLDEHTRTLDDHTKILNDHTRDLNQIKKDAETRLDKRKLLEVRVDTIEKHIGIKKPASA